MPTSSLAAVQTTVEPKLHVPRRSRSDSNHQRASMTSTPYGVAAATAPAQTHKVTSPKQGRAEPETYQKRESKKSKHARRGGDKAAAAARHAEEERTCKEHSFLTDVSDVRKMEQGLLSLLNDFHSGRMQAFGEDCSFEKMDQVREQQERLAKLHFDLDTELETLGMETPKARSVANENLTKLVTDLQELSHSIQGLHSKEPVTAAAAAAAAVTIQHHPQDEARSERKHHRHHHGHRSSHRTKEAK